MGQLCNVQLKYCTFVQHTRNASKNVTMFVQHTRNAPRMLQK